MAQLRWGILGTGGIAKKFAEAVQASTTGTLTAVGSRTQAAADEFGAKYDIPKRYPAYDGVLDDADVDAVYISLPNHLHAEWTIKCARAGKHILCEKPFCVNLAEAEDALNVVRESGVFFLEAFMYRCHPQTRRVFDLLREGAIGDVRLIQASFSYQLGPKYENIRLSNPAAGGGIMDVGCYTASLARLAAGGAEPDEVTGVAQIGPVSRVDELAVASLRWDPAPGRELGCVAALSCGTQANVARDAYIWGSAGSLRIPNPWFPGDGDNVLHLHRAGKEPEEIHVSGEGIGLYTHEADLVAHCVADGRTEAPTPAMTWADTLGNQRTLDRWRQAVGLVFDAEK
jgi:predicted dehydrogenase